MRGSTTSTEIPSFSASSAAFSASGTSRPIATTVTSEPSRSDARLAELDRLDLVRHLALERVERPVLEEDDGVVVVDRAPEETANVLGRRGVDDLQARHVHEPRLELLRVLRARATSRRRPACGS